MYGVEGILYGQHEALIPHGVQVPVYRLGLVEKTAVTLELDVGVTGSYNTRSSVKSTNFVSVLCMCIKYSIIYSYNHFIIYNVR